FYLCAVLLLVFSLCRYDYEYLRDLLSFPTRRSSDLEFAFLVFYKFFNCCLVHTRIMSEHSDRFLLAVVCLADSRPLRPRVCLCSDRKSTRLNSSHVSISYAVFCLKKKMIHNQHFCDV